VDVAGVVHDQVEDHPDPPRVGLVNEAVEVVVGPEQRIDRRVIGDVVAQVQAR
jgi:hypothetical protein